MDIFNNLLKLFHRTNQVSDSTFQEINNALDSGEKCRFCTKIMQFPVGVLPCGHIYDAICLENNLCPASNRRCQLDNVCCPECDMNCEYYDKIMFAAGTLNTEFFKH